MKLCSRCRKELSAVYSYGMCMGWTCPECDAPRKVTGGYSYGAVQSVGHRPKDIEAWCRAFIKQIDRKRKPKMVCASWTRV